MEQRDLASRGGALDSSPVVQALDLEGVAEPGQWGLLSSRGRGVAVEQWEEGEVWSQVELTLFNLTLCLST